MSFISFSAEFNLGFTIVYKVYSCFTDSRRCKLDFVMEKNVFYRDCHLPLEWKTRGKTLNRKWNLTTEQSSASTLVVLGLVREMFFFRVCKQQLSSTLKNNLPFFLHFSTHSISPMSSTRSLPLFQLAFSFVFGFTDYVVQEQEKTNNFLTWNEINKGVIPTPSLRTAS